MNSFDEALYMKRWYDGTMVRWYDFYNEKEIENGTVQVQN
jgi:hypothetical protein